MKKIRAICILMALILGSGNISASAASSAEETKAPAKAADAAKENAAKEKSDDTGFFKDIPGELASPWTTGARPWLIGGVAATGLLFALRKNIGDPMQQSWNQNRPLGGWAKVGDYGGQTIQNSAYAIGMLTHYFITKDNRSLDRFVVMLKASLYASGVTEALKVSVKEARPNNPTDTASFPSGHATIAFAFSSVIVAEHGFFPYGLAAMGFATLTGLSRINDNKHRLHDVVAGATIGSVYGFGVSYFHQARYWADKADGTKGELKEAALDLQPIYTDEDKGLLLTYHF